MNHLVRFHLEDCTALTQMMEVWRNLENSHNAVIALIQGVHLGLALTHVHWNRNSKTASTVSGLVECGQRLTILFIID